MGLALARRGCQRKALVAVAPKLAVIMHAIWSDRTFYVDDPSASKADAAQRTHVKGSQAARSASMSRQLKRVAPYADGGHLNKKIRPGG
ncbi:MAG: hypothetical protein E5V49_13030 [Mesorhizobium sp.]|nr:MAG: hypothetical protein E5V48_11140 [Mesorhizobium sp.]TJW32223.1 MAG: hypothetical protein E5V49_13030 [Mesorhizobium sp.]